MIIYVGLRLELLGGCGKSNAQMGGREEIRNVVVDEVGLRCLRDTQVRGTCRQLETSVSSSEECSVSSCLKISCYSSEPYHQWNRTVMTVIPNTQLALKLCWVSKYTLCTHYLFEFSKQLFVQCVSLSPFHRQGNWMLEGEIDYLQSPTQQVGNVGLDTI